MNAVLFLNKFHKNLLDALIRDQCSHLFYLLFLSYYHHASLFQVHQLLLVVYYLSVIIFFNFINFLLIFILDFNVSFRRFFVFFCFLSPCTQNPFKNCLSISHKKFILCYFQCFESTNHVTIYWNFLLNIPL